MCLCSFCSLLNVSLDSTPSSSRKDTHLSTCFLPTLKVQMPYNHFMGLCNLIIMYCQDTTSQNKKSPRCLRTYRCEGNAISSLSVYLISIICMGQVPPVSQNSHTTHCLSLSLTYLKNIEKFCPLLHPKIS